MLRCELIAFLMVESVSTGPESGGNAKGHRKVRRTSRLLPSRALQGTRARLGLPWYTALARRYGVAMPETQERRVVPRTRVVGDPGARVRDLREIRLLDFSPTGARIEHLDLLRPGAPCALDLPPRGGALGLPAQVVWCTVVGRQRKFEGESYPVSRSGLRFRTLTGA